MHKRVYMLLQERTTQIRPTNSPPSVFSDDCLMALAGGDVTRVAKLSFSLAAWGPLNNPHKFMSYDSYTLHSASLSNDKTFPTTQRIFCLCFSLQHHHCCNLWEVLFLFFLGGKLWPSNKTIHLIMEVVLQLG